MGWFQYISVIHLRMNASQYFPILAILTGIAILWIGQITAEQQLTSDTSSDYYIETEHKVNLFVNIYNIYKITVLGEKCEQPYFEYAESNGLIRPSNKNK